jgi:hypothetical protein
MNARRAKIKLMLLMIVSPIKKPKKGSSCFLFPLLHKNKAKKKTCNTKRTLKSSFVVPLMSITTKTTRLTNEMKSKKEKHMGNS